MLPRQFETLGKGVVLIGKHSFLKVALVEVDMPVHVCRYDQVPCRVHFHRPRLFYILGCCCDSITSDAYIPGSWPVSEAGVSNDQVHERVPPSGLERLNTAKT